jgi:hypothetical protein
LERDAAGGGRLATAMGVCSGAYHEIVKITHGALWDDFYRIRFAGECLTWDDVRLR